MRGFKQILHLSRSIRLKLCNQAHVPLLLKQELFFGRFFRRNSPILIIYLKALVFFYIRAACLFVVIFPTRLFSVYLQDDSTPVLVLILDYTPER